MRVTDIVFQWKDSRGIEVGIDIVIRVTDIGLQWEVTRGMQVCIDIGSKRDRYYLRVGGYSGIHIGTDITNRVTAVV